MALIRPKILTIFGFFAKINGMISTTKCESVLDASIRPKYTIPTIQYLANSSLHAMVYSWL